MAMRVNSTLSAGVASPPSELNGRFYIYIYIYISVPHCTYRNVIHVSNFACVHAITLYVLLILRVHSRSPTMRSIQLVCSVVLTPGDMHGFSQNNL